MAQIKVKSLQNKDVRGLDLAEAVFGYPLKRHLVYEAVCHHNASLRAGTHATKNRVSVSGGGRKPWRQKKTGRARAGSMRSPLWRGGGTVHGPQPRSYDYPFPKRMRRNALRSVLSQKLKEEGLMVVEGWKLDSHRTKDLLAMLSGLGLAGGKTLLVSTEENRNLELAARNLAEVRTARAQALSAYDILDNDTVILSVPAVERLQEWLTP